jgi:radical SAM protein with 4Fe4S-binding SPASM domain
LRLRARAQPWVFSFITARAESFGSIVYNPFLAKELLLDREGTRIFHLLDGKTTLRELHARLGSPEGCAPADMKGKVDQTLHDLQGIAAISVQPRNSPRPPPIIRPREPSESFLSAPRNVTWELTRACNLRCPHCLSDSGPPSRDELDTESAVRLADGLRKAGVFGVSFTGGEPFQRRDLPALVDAVSSRHMSVDIATNGVGISTTIVGEIARRQVFQIQVSIDGIGEAHDRFRGLRGAFEQARDTIRRFRGEGIAVSVSTTVTSHNLDAIDSIVDFALAEGCSAYKAIPFLPAGRGRERRELCLNAIGHKKLCETIVAREAELRGRMGFSIDSTMHYLIDPGLPEPLRSCEGNARIGCSAGQDVLNIGPDGTVYPCPFLRDFPLGSLCEQSLSDIWTESPILMRLRTLKASDLPRGCAACGYLGSSCAGGCRAAAYLETGDLLGPDPTCFKGMP